MLSGLAPSDLMAHNMADLVGGSHANGADAPGDMVAHWDDLSKQLFG